MLGVRRKAAKCRALGEGRRGSVCLPQLRYQLVADLGQLLNLLVLEEKQPLRTPAAAQMGDNARAHLPPSQRGKGQPAPAPVPATAPLGIVQAPWGPPGSPLLIPGGPRCCTELGCERAHVGKLCP